MLVISSREFRENQKSYLDRIDEGLEVLIRRGKSRSYRIVPVEKDDSLMTKEEFDAMLDTAREQVKRGESTLISSEEEMKEFFRQIELSNV